ncbi:hypothetical protein F5Y15DRAFT_372014 [Xylariaceae sp. FL0016]|nr:hypothetical protein F5Y15DRAFT_372014 [Xylariaceae sp. FL0016]
MTPKPAALSTTSLAHLQIASTSTSNRNTDNMNTHSHNPSMGLSTAIDAPRLDTLPTDILLIILSYFNTAQTVSRLTATCRGLNVFVSANGWRVFVTTCFQSLQLPRIETEPDWMHLAQSLTAQSRDWAKRAFIFSSLSPPERRRPNGRRYHPGGLSQSIPGNLIVDAYAQSQGPCEDEFVVWGAGEDVVARIRSTQATHTRSEVWESAKGAELGYRAGKDDVTAISILKTQSRNDANRPDVLVGRANGDLRLLSMDSSDFGRTLIQFQSSTASDDAIEQGVIQNFDIFERADRFATATKENILVYSLDGRELSAAADPSQGTNDLGDAPVTEPMDCISLKKAKGSASFEFVRSLKYMNRDTLAVALNRSFSPIQYLTTTPSGIEVIGSAKITNEYPTLKSNPRTVRALLPVDVSSVASGGGNALLSSWDDGTIRLQDLRTPSAIDYIYQDNFEVSTPINALISHGLERFIAGSAYSHMLKIFDFRWPKGYYHTDPLPCSNERPFPVPKPPTLVAEPDLHDSRRSCDFVLGRPCRWHALSRQDFYRPNCNVYLPFKNYASSPIYSLAKPSDTSPTIFAGLSGLLVEVTLKSCFGEVSQPTTKPLYSMQRGKVAILETGDGSAISDISKCQRVPEIRRQSFSGGLGEDDQMAVMRKRHRLDVALQNTSELHHKQL